MKFTKEQIEKAMACKSVDELLTLAKSDGAALTREQAETYFAHLSMNELTPEELAKVAGGVGMGLQLAGLQNPQSLNDFENNSSRCKCDCDTVNPCCQEPLH
ncbi:MAG: hypothetical protein IJT21_02870 [Synergistaceae bacterium]|nr:hypothetical protein [Synergistaceae bacterium]